MVKYSEEQINQLFHSLSDPTRREIIRLVARKDRNATELADSFNMSFPAVSKHLKVLEQAGFISRQVDGRIHRFKFNEKAMKAAYKWIKFYERFWLGQLDQLDQFLKADNKEK